MTTVNAPGAPAVERWPTELPLLAVCIVVSLGIYLLLLLSVVGALYALAFGLFLLVGHAVLVAQVRGSAVRLGPDQFPALYRRVLDLATRIGLDDVPDAYLMQAGGALNAFATRFLGLNVIVLYSGLLEACGDDAAARDMIIAHELGHIRAGHVKARWLIAPAMLVPFLGTALSRAREYTCDRYGLAGAGDRDGALLGLTILAAGGAHARAVNRRALARQREDLATGWLTIGEWFGTHPPLSRRIAALEPALAEGSEVPATGRVRALAIIAVFVAAVVLGSALLVGMYSRTLREVRRQGTLQPAQSELPLGEGEGR